MKRKLLPKEWGLLPNGNGELMVEECNTLDLAKTYGTPLHVVNETHLQNTMAEFKEGINTLYPGPISIHYAFKCNSVPHIVGAVHRAGLKAEVMSEFELQLARHMNFRGQDIIVNGPCKSESFLRKCLQEKVRLIVIDSLEELHHLYHLCKKSGSKAQVLLRINPDYIPRGMNAGAATGSRKGCAFGLDLKGKEIVKALNSLKTMTPIRFMGYHFHIGTGIHNPRDYSGALRQVAPLFAQTRSLNFDIKIIDVGGGFASRTAKEMTSRELLMYQGMAHLPSGPKVKNTSTINSYFKEIADTLQTYFTADELPELILEPGRCIVSQSQFLLLTVHRIKNRPKVRKWLVTDGGLGTVTLPTFYEYHEILLCNDVYRPIREKVTIIGPVCFASDVVYRNKPMPEVKPGEVLAIMDSGAYFNSLESSFGFPRPAIAAVKGSCHRLVRRRETFADMVGRDLPNTDK